MQTIKLWHDDVRPAPEGWVWARTNEDAKRILMSDKVEETSLDHDLGYGGPPPGPCPECHGVKGFNCTVCDGDGEIGRDVLYVKGTDSETGLDLVKWMIATNHVPAKITIHSWNCSGAWHMRCCLKAAGHVCTLKPYSVEKALTHSFTTV